MATDVVIPKLGMTMREGTIVEWAVPDGATVAPNDVVFVLSTDKLDTEVTAEAAGTLRHGAAAGETHPVATVVGWILTDADRLDDRPESRVVATPYARRLARER